MGGITTWETREQAARWIERCIESEKDVHDPTRLSILRGDYGVKPHVGDPRRARVVRRLIATWPEDGLDTSQYAAYQGPWEEDET